MRFFRRLTRLFTTEVTSATKHIIYAGGRKREYYLYVPSTGTEPRKLVIAFHGGGGKAKSFAKQAGLIAMADKYGLVVAMPEGARRNIFSKRSWNADSINPSGWAEKNGIDDLGFISALIDHAGSQTSLQPLVCLMGHSKGGMMAYCYATYRGFVAAVGVCAATLSAKAPLSAVSTHLLHIHGTDDQNVPIEGNDKWPPVSRGIDFFTEANGPEMVTLDVVQGGGHEWFGHATDDIATMFK